MDSFYVKSFSSETAKAYYLSSITRKTEQQKFLEEQLSQIYSTSSCLSVSDLCCGSGSVSYHLSHLFKNWSFHLLDLSEQSELIVKELPARFIFDRCSAYSTPYEDAMFDIVICWNTILHLESPELLFREITRILKPGGRLFVSTLINLDHETDILARVRDLSDSSHINQFGYPREYIRNTYSVRTLQEYIGRSLKIARILPFNIPIRLLNKPSGIGTYTITTLDGVNLQVSGGFLMNWAYLEIFKPEH
jgi:ubiquinone/menaquinone biosynthesis C-methylase UbiE